MASACPLQRWPADRSFAYERRRVALWGSVTHVIDVDLMGTREAAPRMRVPTRSTPVVIPAGHWRHRSKRRAAPHGLAHVPTPLRNYPHFGTIAVSEDSAEAAVAGDAHFRSLWQTASAPARTRSCRLVLSAGLESCSVCRVYAGVFGDGVLGHRARANCRLTASR